MKSKRFTLQTIIDKLLEKGESKAKEYVPDPNEKPVPTSIRLKPHTRHWLEVQAELFNTSYTGMIGIILDGLAQVGISNDDTISGIGSRFDALLESHEISLPDAADLLKDYGFRLSTLRDQNKTLDLLTPVTIEFLAKTFFVEKDWLKGVSEYVTTPFSANTRWYKNVRGFCDYLIDYSIKGMKPHVMFITRQSADFEAARLGGDQDRNAAENVAIAIRLLRKTPGGHEFYTYEVCEFQRWNYRPCRDQLKLLFKFCDAATQRSRLSFGGYRIEEESFKRFLSGKVIPASIIGNPRGHMWYPDEYAPARGEPDKEKEGWSSIEREYEELQLSELIMRYEPRNIWE